MVPIMAGCYLLITVLLIVINFRMIPSVIGRIFQEAFGFRQVVAGGFGAVLMNGIKRGLFPMRQAPVPPPARLQQQRRIIRQR